MAKITAPFLSLGASGSIAKTLVAGTWKGIKTMRSYAVPTNPRSAAQVAQRETLAMVLAMWQTTVRSESNILAWNRAAQALGNKQSGVNAFVSNLVKAWNASEGASGTYTYSVYGGSAFNALYPLGHTFDVSNTKVAVVTEIADSTGSLAIALAELPAEAPLALDESCPNNKDFYRVAVVIDSVEYWVSGVLPAPVAT
jgi:hypothetical protein